MVKENRVSRRYGQAIFEYLKDPSLTKKVSEELVEMGILFENNSELKFVLHGSLFSDKQRKGILSSLSEKMRVSAETKKILFMLSRNRRLDQSQAIGEALRLILLASENIVPLRVESPSVLDDGERKKITDKFKKVFGKEVAARFEEVPGVLGGLKVFAGGRTFDGTIKTQLNVVAEKLMEG